MFVERWIETWPRISSSKTTLETLDDVVHRVSVLERTVKQLSGSLPSQADDVDAIISKLPSPEHHAPDRQSSTKSTAANGKENHKFLSTIRSSYGTASTDEDVAMMLEDFAMGHRINRSRAAQDLECEPVSPSYLYPTPSSVDGPSFGQYGPPTLSFPHPSSPTDGMSPVFGLGDGHPLGLLIDPTVNVTAKLVALLPSASRCRLLVQFYFERLEWYSKVLHAPTFQSDAESLLRQIAIATPSALNPDPVPSALAHISLPFLSVYFMVLCLALHLIEPGLCRQLNIGFTEATELGTKMYNAAQATFYVGNFLANHSLEALQSFILMGVYRQNVDEADSHWALLGSAIKIAQNLGISRLGSESEDRRYTGSWRSLIKRETARRVWWSLIFDDWSHAAAHNGAYSVHPSQNHTALPANINDVDLVEGRPLREMPETQYTEMTLSRTRFRFVELYRQIVDNMQSPSPSGYGFVLEMDAKLRKMQEDIPSYFQDNPHGEPGNILSKEQLLASAKGVKGLELTLSLIMGETRQLRLHRPFLFRGYKDKRFAKSRDQCISSARAILNYLKSNDEHSAILLKWWIVLFYGFAASVVLFIDLCHQKADDAPDLEYRRAELREALDLFKTAEHISTVSRNAIVLLEGLMSAEPEIPSKPSRKRSAPDDDDEPFERIVKRMIVDANRNVGTPGSQSSFGSPTNARSSPIAASFGHQRSNSSRSGSFSSGSGINSGYPARTQVPISNYHRRSSSSGLQTSWPYNSSNGSPVQSPRQRITGLPSPPHSNAQPHSAAASMVPGFNLGWGQPGRDALAPGVLFRDSGIFDASMKDFDEVTINELGQMLWSADGYGISDIGDIGASVGVDIGSGGTANTNLWPNGRDTAPKHVGAGGIHV
ncbi:hypothetical protein VKT23_019531 [Stygiomarasmius scandens]|uniref:Xylanolytic transcriptional activator regulatory domain-containing protein n=1 Tax=Marasmiellus scandens TaxID=2682957 RepID=A0ABR1IMQ3_9AGAR